MQTAKNQDKAKSERCFVLFLEMHTQPTTHFLSIKHTTMYTFLLVCNKVSRHIEKKPKSQSWENEFNHTYVNTNKLRKMSLPISRLHCTFFNLSIFDTNVNSVLENNTKQKKKYIPPHRVVMSQCYMFHVGPRINRKINKRKYTFL